MLRCETPLGTPELPGGAQVVGKRKLPSLDERANGEDVCICPRSFVGVFVHYLSAVLERQSLQIVESGRKGGHV